ncbi:hypothetical protein niasHT_028837 [Heterodera trifolii]|uniref:MATH domain-containing protein n=1 Tax=Heterodera trifolii TaxID=157864 RepID=A0ABD2KQC7_9BILA
MSSLSKQRNPNERMKHLLSTASAESAVEVPDVEPTAFRVMLSFIYSDDLNELDGDNAMALLYAAKKYGIDRLFTPCLDIPISKLSNVFLAFAQARLFDLEDFSNQCLHYICQNAGELFESEEFLQIDQNLLGEIFERDQLVISNEFELWKAALRWADEKCRQNAIECSAENRRAALGPALFKIRFPLIPSDAFVKQIVLSGVLTNDEFVGVYQFHCHPNLHPMPRLFPLKFSCHGRISDCNIAKGNRGTLALEIKKFSKFARKEVGSSRESKTEVSIKGLPWKILAEIRTKEKRTEKCLALFLWSEKEKPNWSCKCSATLRIVSQKNGAKDLAGKFNDRLLNNKNPGLGFANFIAFAELMDPCKGFYDENENKVIVAIDVIVEEENKAKFDSNPNKSSGKIEMEIDKLSEFAQEILFSERVSETVFVKGIPWKIVPRKKTRIGAANVRQPLELFHKRAKQQLVLRKEVFSTKTKCGGFDTFITFADLMDPSKGFYDSEEDKVTFAIDFTVEEKNGTKKRKLANKAHTITDHSVNLSFAIKQFFS